MKTERSVSVPLIELTEQNEALLPELREVFEELVRSGQYVLGPYVERFEKQLASYCQAEHAVGMSSGTDALLAALMALEIGPGDEVITTPFTFFATAGTIARVGAQPVFVDIEPGTFNIDPAALEGAITPATKAIMPVHLFGLPADMGRIMEIARAHKLYVIEDAAQALGARYEDQPVGAIGDIGCFSFYPTKTLAAMGDAGACVTQDAGLAEKLRQVRVHGAEPGKDYWFPMIGGNFRIDALQAAMLSIKLDRLDDWIKARRRLAARYHGKFEPLPVATPFEPEILHHVYNQYTVRIRSGQREAVQHHLRACGVGTRVYYPTPLHLQPCFAYMKHGRGRFPVSEKAAREVLSLPLYPEMDREQQNVVIRSLAEFFQAE